MTSQFHTHGEQLQAAGSSDVAEGGVASDKQVASNRRLAEMAWSRVQTRLGVSRRGGVGFSWGDLGEGTEVPLGASQLGLFES